MPTDPSALRTNAYAAADAAIAKAPSTKLDPDSLVFTYIATVLARVDLVSPTLAASLYQLASTIPGIEMLGDTKNLDGAAGVAIGHEMLGMRTEVILDSAGGQCIGSRSIMLKPDALDSSGIDSNGTSFNVPSGWPVGTAIKETAVAVQVIDKVPGK